MFTSKYSKSYLLLLILSLLLIFFTQKFKPIPFNNQNEYYLHAYVDTHPEYLQNDWFVTTEPKHIAFSALIEFFYNLNIIEAGSYFMQTVLTVIYYSSLLVFIQFFLKKIGETRSEFIYKYVNTISILTLIAIIIARNSKIIGAILEPTPLFSWWGLFWNMFGLADQWLASGSYFQASEFGILMLLAIAVVLWERWYLAAVLLAISVNFSFTYSIHAGILVVIFAGWLAAKKQYRKAFWSLFIFGMLVLPVTLYSATLLGDPLASAANEIWAVHAFPEHTLPSIFWHNGNAIKLVTIFIGFAICLYLRLYLLALIQGIGLGYVVGGLIFVSLTNSHTIAILFPWRASVYLVPLASTIIATAVFAILIMICSPILSKYPDKIKYTQILLWALLILEIFSFVDWQVNQAAEIDSRIVMYGEIAEATNPEDIILLPVDPKGFFADARMVMRRPIYVDRKTVPILGTEVMEWWERVQFARSFYEQPVAQQLELCQEAGIDYFVTVETTETVPTPLIETEEYKVYACE